MAVRAQLNITRQPEALVVQSGQTATLSVGVTGAPAPTFQWRRYGYAIPGATTASYSIPAVCQFDNDFYDVVISSGGTTAVSQTARLLVTLKSYPGAVTVDLSRSLRIDGPENVDAVGPAFVQAALADGRFYLAGAFTSVDGQARRDLARLNANGTFDHSFAPPSFDVSPRSIALQADGKLLVTGSFKLVGGVATSGIVRLNADGSRDHTFVVGTGFSGGLPGVVTVAPNGSIYVSNTFITSYQGNSVYGYVARLTSTGALDPTFTSPTFKIGASGTNPSGFLLGPSGEIYVHGGFDTVNDVARKNLARLLPTGQVDLTFNPGSGPNGWLNAITVLRNGQVVIGGNFTAYNGTAVGRIARINPNGTLDPTFATGSGFGQQVGFVAELPGNALFVGSPSNIFKGTPVGPGVRLTASGSLDTTFVYSLTGWPESLASLPGNRLLVCGTFLNDYRPGLRVLEGNGDRSFAVASPALRFPGRVRCFAPLPGGKVFVAGDFSHVNGVPAPFIMRLNADLTRDLTFPAGPGPTTQVTAGTVQPDGKIVLFTYNGMMRLNADGSTDPTFGTQAPGGFWYGSKAVVLRDGRLFVPTDSPTWWNGSAVTNGFVVLEPNGMRATNHPFLPGPNAGAKIAGVQRLAGGQLLVVGSFTSWNGISRANAVRLNADGSVDPTFTPDGTVSILPYASAIARNGWSIQRDGKLIVTAGSSSGTGFVRFNANGSRDASFTSGLPSLLPSPRFMVQPDDRVIVIGQGDPGLDGGLPTIFSRLAPNGGIDGSFVIRGTRIWYDAMLADNGELLSSDGSGYLHRYAALPPPTIATPPSAQSVVSGTSVLLSVTATGEEPLTYQWLKDGAPVAGATNATLTVDTAPIGVAGSYAVVVSNAGGSVTSAAALVSVSARSVAGVAFGTIGGDAGTFSLYVRADGTGAFLAYLHAPQTVFVARELAVGADRRFRFRVTSSPGATVSTSEVEGMIAVDGSISATLLGRSLTAPPATTSGRTSALVGFYEAAETKSSNLNYTIVGANGTAYTVMVGTGLTEAGSIAVDAAGALIGTTLTNVSVTGSVQASSGLCSVVFQVGGATARVFAGADNTKRDDREKLVNVSTRSLVATGGSFTAGFVVVGNRPKPVLIRAIGPTLSAFMVDGALSAARLEVFRSSTSIAVGNDWSLAPNAAGIAATAARVGAFALPATSRDAALLLVLDPGNYSATVTGQGGATGAALVEVYDATEGPIARSERIINVSTLARAGAGGDALTVGFFIEGRLPKRVLIRGVGPTLAQFGVSGVLSRPQVALYSGVTVLAQNAGWSTMTDAAVVAAAAAQVEAFAFPAGSADAALVLNLLPGSYSAQVSGVGNATGIALVEVYELP